MRKVPPDSVRQPRSATIEKRFDGTLPSWVVTTRPLQM